MAQDQRKAAKMARMRCAGCLQTVVEASTAAGAKDAEATEIKDRNEALENIEEENKS